jgi:alkylhydroperoxidase/carboxymuconolactone decarboxylase family protein YurZ
MAGKGELYLHEQVMLMALNDERGTLQPGAGNSHYALAAAVLSELLLRERISITDDKKKFVEVVNAKPVSEPILDECLEKISTAKRRRRAADWVASFASQGKVGQRIAEQLCDRGILHETEGRILLIFKRKLFPEIDHKPEQHLMEELRRAIWSDPGQMIKPKMVALIGLANATGLLSVYFNRKELKERKARIAEIVKGGAISGATSEAIAAAQAAMMAMIATTAAISAATSH